MLLFWLGSENKQWSICCIFNQWMGAALLVHLLKFALLHIYFHITIFWGEKENKTGLQPVSKPVEQILRIFQKGFYSIKVQKCSFIWCGAFAAAKPVSKPLDTQFYHVFPLFAYFSCFLLKRKQKRGNTCKKQDFNQQIGCTAPFCWMEYTTIMEYTTLMDV